MLKAAVPNVLVFSSHDAIIFFAPKGFFLPFTANSAYCNPSIPAAIFPLMNICIHVYISAKLK